MSAFVDTDLKPLERLQSVWFARYFADGWRAWLLSDPKVAEVATARAVQRAEVKSGSTKGTDSAKPTRKSTIPTQKDKLEYFITPNAYACLQLNSENMLLLLHWVQLLPEELRLKIPLALWLFGSQQNEHFFRALRARGAVFNFMEAMNRTAAIQLYVEVIARLGDKFWVRPHHKHASVESMRRPVPSFEPYTESHLRNTLIAARDEAIKLLKQLGVEVPQLVEPQLPPELNDLEVDDAELTGVHETELHGIWSEAMRDLQQDPALFEVLPLNPK